MRRTKSDRDDDLAIGRLLERKDAEIDRLRALLYEAVQIPTDWPDWFARARKASEGR